MRSTLFCAAALLALAAPFGHAQAPSPAAAPATHVQAAPPPEGGPFLPLPAADRPLTRIAFGSCSGSEKPIPILAQIAADKPDLYVYSGDNVYGDARGNDPSLPELREAYARLAASPYYQTLRQTTPIIATWDDHDYGLNDAGVEFFAKDYSKQLFERFFATGERLSAHEGVYDAYAFGPSGERVQILLLDTRWSRTKLARLAEPGPRGPYAQTRDPNAHMLGEAQWAWLAAKLREPADVRILVSSIQVLADGHDYETWDNMPREQRRLIEVIKRSKAKGLIMISGDRHVAGLYRRDDLLPYSLYELTTSGLNRASGRGSDEISTGQLGSLYSFANYGMVQIDWKGRALTLQVKDATGLPVRERRITFSELGLH